MSRCEVLIIYLTNDIHDRLRYIINTLANGYGEGDIKGNVTMKKISK